MKRVVFTFILCSLFLLSYGQEFIPLWSEGKMPNSRGINILDSIQNERVYQVGKPGIYKFSPSKEENKETSVLIIAGGGYARLAYEISGFQLAKWFNTMGITAFVLFHRLPHSPDVEISYKAPLQDAQRAIKLIRSRAKEWDLNPDKVGVMGSSAGGHLAACLSTLKEDWAVIGDGIDPYTFSPDFTLLISPVISMKEYTHKGSKAKLLREEADNEEFIGLFSCNEQITSETPPAFLVHALNDKSVSPQNSILYYTSLIQKGVAGSALHIFPQGGHSISLRDNVGSCELWPVLAEKWLKEIKMVD